MKEIHSERRYLEEQRESKEYDETGRKVQKKLQ